MFDVIVRNTSLHPLLSSALALLSRALAFWLVVRFLLAVPLIVMGPGGVVLVVAYRPRLQDEVANVGVHATFLLTTGAVVVVAGWKIGRSIAVARCVVEL